MRIRRLRDEEMEDVVQLSLLAWAPVFDSFERVLGSEIFLRIYPEWRTIQREAVKAICTDTEKNHVWVADLDGTVAGFIVYSLNREHQTGEVELLAVHPEHQGRGIGTELNAFALGKMREAGMRLAVAATGGDSGHAPARRSYEKAGYVGLPLVRYYKDL